METVTVYKDSYDQLCEERNAASYNLATLKGMLIGLSGYCDEHPQIVSDRIKEIAQKLELEVDISKL